MTLNSCVRLAISGLLASVLASPTRLEAASVGKLEVAILPASILRVEAVELPANEAPASKSARWHGLVCNADGCELRRIKLDVQAVAGTDRLRISYLPAGRRKPLKGEFTIAVVHGMPAAEKQSVPTWYTLRRPRNADDAANGSLGLSIKASEQGVYRIIPRWRRDAKDDSLALYLETKKSRQRLGAISLETVNAGLKPSDILIWAGDLDGDGKVDLITRAGKDGAKRGLHLWLSSRATGSELVGLAASLEQWTDVEEAEGC
jgi:hypothetical protein